MKKVVINVPDDCEVQVVRKEVKFKKGDIISAMNRLIAIFEKSVLEDGERVVYFSTAYSPLKETFIRIDEVNYGIGYESDCTLASTEQKDTLIKALKKEAKTNPRARKVLKEVFNKEIEPVIRTYQDLIDNAKIIKGYFISSANASIVKYGSAICRDRGKRVASSEKVAKSMLAMAMISQLIPYYGGAITDEEWANDNILKYRIVRVGSHIMALKSYNIMLFSCFSYS